VCASDKVTLWVSTPGFYTSRKGGGDGCSTTTLVFTAKAIQIPKKASLLTHLLFSIGPAEPENYTGQTLIMYGYVSRESSSWGNKSPGIKAGLVQGFAAKRLDLP
jgi:hypothetical protein